MKINRAGADKRQEINAREIPESRFVIRLRVFIYRTGKHVAVRTDRLIRTAGGLRRRRSGIRRREHGQRFVFSFSPLFCAAECFCLFFCCDVCWRGPDKQIGVQLSFFLFLLSAPLYTVDDRCSSSGHDNRRVAIESVGMVWRGEEGSKTVPGARPTFSLSVQGRTPMTSANTTYRFPPTVVVIPGPLIALFERRRRPRTGTRRRFYRLGRPGPENRVFTGSPGLPHARTMRAHHRLSGGGGGRRTPSLRWAVRCFVFKKKIQSNTSLCSRWTRKKKN